MLGKIRQVRRKRHFSSTFFINAIILSRQARDKHRESTQNRYARRWATASKMRGSLPLMQQG